MYTGDFRYEDVELSSLSGLHSVVGGDPLPIDELYLDTTFCSRQYPRFPPRAEALERIWEIARDWIRKNGMYRNQRGKHVVLFHLPGESLSL